MTGLRRAGFKPMPIRAGVLLVILPIYAWGQSQCPPVNFLVARTVNLKPTATSHINLAQQPFGSYTGYEVTDAAPHRVIAVTPHFEKQFAACLPHDLPATPAEGQLQPVVNLATASFRGRAVGEVGSKHRRLPRRERYADSIRRV